MGGISQPVYDSGYDLKHYPIFCRREKRKEGEEEEEYTYKAKEGEGEGEYR